jgi:uncharacterized protein YqeY
MIDNIKAQLKDAMFSKNKNRITALRNFIGKLRAKEIDKKESLTETESLRVLQSIAKQLKDSIDQYTKGGRKDLADNEQDELEILNEFLPVSLSEQEMSVIIEEVIKASNASSMKDMGKVMGMAISKMGARGDGSIISKIVKEKLS